ASSADRAGERAHLELAVVDRAERLAHLEGIDAIAEVFGVGHEQIDPDELAPRPRPWARKRRRPVEKCALEQIARARFEIEQLEPHRSRAPAAAALRAHDARPRGDLAEEPEAGRREAHEHELVDRQARA